MELVIHDYELSIWKDVWAHPTLLDDEGTVTQILNGEDVLDEEKSAILSTDNMVFGGKAINITLKVKNNGTHELTFDLPGKYIDPNTGKKVHNYLRDFIDNETKVKLHFKDKWYCFHVKKVVEKREKNYNFFNYTCEDSFITELSKTGYKLTFNEYTDYYIEQLHTFGDAILEGSEWSYDKDKTEENCDLIEYQEEKLVEYITTERIIVHPLIDTDKLEIPHQLYGTASGISVIIPAGTMVYGFYSEVNNEGTDESEGLKQIIYVPENIEYPGEEYVISGKTIVNKQCNYMVSTSVLSNAKWETDEEEPSVPHFHRLGYYGLKIVYNEYTEYCSALDRYVKRYYRTKNNNTTSDLYSYTKTHVLVPEIATNYAANGKDMSDTTGWAPYYATDKLTVERIGNSSQIITYETLEDGTVVPNVGSSMTATPATYGIAATKIKNEEGKGIIVNTGPFSRNLVIDSPTVFALKLSCKWINIDNVDYTSNNNGQLSSTGTGIQSAAATVKICQPRVNLDKDSYYKDIVTEASALDDDGNYDLVSLIELGTINSTQSQTGQEQIESDQYYLINFNSEMLKEHGGSLKNLFITIEFDANTNVDNVFCIEELEFFEAWTIDGQHTQPAGGWGERSWAKLAGRQGEQGAILKDGYVVPRWRTDDDNLNYVGTFTNWQKGLKTWEDNLQNLSSGSEFQYSSAAGIYHAMMEKFDAWKKQIFDEEKAKYTLVTSDSIVTGETFEEELYFTLPEYQPLFADPIVYYCDPEAQGYTIEKWYNNRKYRTLKQEKSNRFNLSQELSKLFKVYPVYEIQFYPNGKIKKHLYDSEGNEITSSGKTVAYSLRDKRLYYTENKGTENKYGFKYGHNLTTISRTIDSSNIVTKMFVADNTSQYAKDGICSIARATDNVGKDTYLLNFNYFIDRKKISRERVEKDVYSREYVQSHSWAETCNIMDTDSTNPLFKDLRASRTYNTDIQPVKIYRGFLPTIGAINTRYDYLAEEQAKLEKFQLIVLEASVQTYTSTLKGLREQLAQQKQLLDGYVKENTNKKAAEYLLSVERISSRIVIYEWYLEGAKYLYEIYADLYNQYECEMRHLLYWKKQVEDKFNTRYESLIKEGTWQDSKYLEDNSYYLDAEKVLVDSCGPKITYNISVVDLSMLNKYKFTDFNIGDVTYIEDYEFFEDDPDTSDKYYLEKTIVSAITYNLDNPSKNTIALQNYTTKFDDLFSRITASVQSLTFNEAIYQRAGKFTSNGQIDTDTLEDTLTQNKLKIVGNQDVHIDSNGVLVTDLRIPSNKVRIEGCGVSVTSDGGNTWRSAIGNGGINAGLLNIGAINTQKITIFNENYSSFVWDKDGITAYGVARKVNNSDNNTVDTAATSSTYVRFNQYGLFFTKDNSTFEEELKTIVGNASSVLDSAVTQYIMDNANVAITFDGFSINGGEGGRVRLNSTDGLVMSTEKGLAIKVGYIDHIQSVNPFWGLYAQGAYIEGKLYSDSTVKRNIIVNGSGVISANDTNRAILTGGRFSVYRSIVNQDENSETTVQLKPITTFGSSLIIADNTSQTSSTTSDATGTDEVEQETKDAPSTDLLRVGSSIHIDKEGKFWSVAAYYKGDDGKGHYKTKLIYAKDAVPSGPETNLYEENTFYISCNCVAPHLSTPSDKRLKTDIQDLDERYIHLFDNLRVKKFKMDNSDDDKYRLGFVAQEVEESIKKAGLEKDNLNLVTKYMSNYKGLSYTEILTLCVYKIQQLEKELNKIKGSVN